MRGVVQWVRDDSETCQPAGYLTSDIRRGCGSDLYPCRPVVSDRERHESSSMPGPLSPASPAVKVRREHSMLVAPFQLRTLGDQPAKTSPFSPANVFHDISTFESVTTSRTSSEDASDSEVASAQRHRMFHCFAAC